jgi:hypothetical protein
LHQSVLRDRDRDCGCSGYSGRWTDEDERHGQNARTTPSAIAGRLTAARI